MASTFEDDIRDAENRKNNIIIYGVPESTAEDGLERKIDDTKFLCKLFEEAMELDGSSDSIGKVIRLGRKSEDNDRPRPLLVGFDTVWNKSQVLRETRKLKGKEEYASVTLKHDMTKAQRERQKRLTAEAKRMEDEDTSGDFIYRVRGPLGRRGIMKIKKTTS